MQPNTDHGGYPQVLELRGLERESSDQRCMFSSPFGNLISHYRLSNWHLKLSISLLWAWLMWVNPCGPDNLWELRPIQFLDLQWENQPWIVMTILTWENQALPPYTHMPTHTYTHIWNMHNIQMHTQTHSHTHLYTHLWGPVWGPVWPGNSLDDFIISFSCNCKFMQLKRHKTFPSNLLVFLHLWWLPTFHWG